jgi:hypothetical protein
VIVVAVRWYLRFNLSYRDVEELLVERGVEVDHVTVYRWVQRSAPLLADAARFCRHSPGAGWHVDETYVKVNGVWRYVYRAVDQYGQVIDVLVSTPRRGRGSPLRLPNSRWRSDLGPIRVQRVRRSHNATAPAQHQRRGLGPQQPPRSGRRGGHDAGVGVRKAWRRSAPSPDPGGPDQVRRRSPYRRPRHRPGCIAPAPGTAAGRFVLPDPARPAAVPESGFFAAHQINIDPDIEGRYCLGVSDS